MHTRRARSAVNRREFLGRAGLFAGAIALGPSLLAACGGDDDDSSSASPEDVDTGGGGDPNRLVMSNWPLYIDPTEGGTKGSVDLFREETGINFSYKEDFNDNNEFFAKIQPDLQAGKRLPQDIIVPSFWLTARLIDLDWVDGLPLDEIPNKSNVVESLQNPSWDPDGLYSIPWQSGITGIAYNIEATGRELKIVDDLFDPAFKGKIGMLTEMRDTIGLLMLSTGKDPSKPTFDDAQEAFDKLEKANNDVQIRAFTGNDYQDDLVAGNFVACIGWSGDISQLALDEPNLRFVVPEEGGIRWSDTMVMPKGARNRTAAAKWINYVYDPVNAARIAAYIGFISPVAGVQEEFAKNPDPEIARFADSELMFPTEDILSQTSVFGDLDEDEETQFDERFADITEG
jgi:spermidine/putrescine transport system substrate-binding protein